MKPIVSIIAILAIAISAFAGTPSHAAAPVVVTGPAVTTPVVNGGSVVITFPAVAGNYSSAVVSLDVVADSSATGTLFIEPTINNRSGNGSLYFTQDTHVESAFTWRYVQKQGVKSVQDGAVTVGFAVYNPVGATMSATIIPTVTLSK